MGDDDEALAAMRAEVEKIRDQAASVSAGADRKAMAWNRIDLLLGFPAAVLATAAGATGLASSGSRIIAALLALTSAALTAGRSFLRSDTRRLSHRRSRHAWLTLEGEARLLLTRTGLTAEQMHSELSRLFAQRTDAMTAYERAFSPVADQNPPPTRS